MAFRVKLWSIATRLIVTQSKTTIESSDFMPREIPGFPGIPRDFSPPSRRATNLLHPPPRARRLGSQRRCAPPPRARSRPRTNVTAPPRVRHSRRALRTPATPAVSTRSQTNLLHPPPRARRLGSQRRCVPARAIAPLNQRRCPRRACATPAARCTLPQLPLCLQDPASNMA